MSLSLTDKLQRTLRKREREVIKLQNTLQEVRDRSRKNKLIATKLKKEVDELKTANMRLRKNNRQLFIDLTEPPGVTM
jgi:hypothetical protein